MIRLVGGGMIFAGCLFSAFLINKKSECRLKAMYRVVEIMEYIELGIREEKKVLPDIFMELSKRLPEDYARPFRELTKDAENGREKDWIASYRQEMKGLLQEKQIGEEVWDNVLGILDGGGTALGENMTGRIERGKEQLLHLIREEEEEYRRRKGLITRIGILSGGILVLILI